MEAGGVFRSRIHPYGGGADDFSSNVLGSVPGAVGAKLSTMTGRNSHDWTDWRTRSAIGACREFASEIRISPLVRVVTEHTMGDRRRIDVAALCDFNIPPLVLFESELGMPGGKEPWTFEFAKLCEPWAQSTLRVVTGIFRKGQGPRFRSLLENWLAPMEHRFRTGPSGPYLLAFGPESMRLDPGQRWLAYYLDPDFHLHELASDPPLILDRVQT